MKFSNVSKMLFWACASKMALATRPTTSGSLLTFIGHGRQQRSLVSETLTRIKSFSGVATDQKLPITCGEEVMSQKGHGTSEKPVQKDLRWNCDFETADRICNFNRHYAEHAGYWATTNFLNEVKDANEVEDYYDSVTGKLLFKAPIGRSLEAFLKESASHGWPSFRDKEVNWDYVRCLENGECVSIDGTHLGKEVNLVENIYSL
uniref:Uncharacterized protein n=1 Tax=Corethron hystrix TaxID=216773 RepID=A0A7S1BPX0_9STRA|mmetsp:Transcript_35380/g.82045  ORF Transcript_35380/g.82045 Transcript_35380/m.82045 type:complete len:205 (+) Transcript_35380:155-769(+)